MLIIFPSSPPLAADNRS